MLPACAVCFARFGRCPQFDTSFLSRRNEQTCVPFSDFLHLAIWRLLRIPSLVLLLLACYRTNGRWFGSAGSSIQMNVRASSVACSMGNWEVKCRYEEEQA